MYIQGGSADIWKENILEELETGEIEYEIMEEFLTVLKKEFGRGEEGGRWKSSCKSSRGWQRKADMRGDH